MFAESWYGSQALKNFFKGLFLKILADVFFVSGERSRQHFIKQLGIPARRILCKYSVVDNQHFSRKGSHSREPVILCVARFSPEKNLSCLIEAFQKSRLAEGYKLRIIGGGPDRKLLEAIVDERRRVELLDWVEYADLPDQYGQARFFILPSIFEPWGLVINEAMAGGLPIIASDACGCVPDLVTRSNGFVFPADDKEELTRLLDQIAELKESDWEKLSTASTNIISGYRCEDWAEQLRKGFLKDADN
nr:glycosyltransferase family 4 protein [Oceanipulchritudo coccoides]